MIAPYAADGGEGTISKLSKDSWATQTAATPQQKQHNITGSELAKPKKEELVVLLRDWNSNNSSNRWWRWSQAEAKQSWKQQLQIGKQKQQGDEAETHQTQQHQRQEQQQRWQVEIDEEVEAGDDNDAVNGQ